MGIVLIGLSFSLLDAGSDGVAGGMLGGTFGGFLGASLANQNNNQNYHRASESRVDSSVYNELERIRYEFNRKIEELQNQRGSKIGETIMQRLAVVEEAMQKEDENRADLDIIRRDIAALNRELRDLKERLVESGNLEAKPFERRGVRKKQEAHSLLTDTPASTSDLPAN